MRRITLVSLMLCCAIGCGAKSPPPAPADQTADDRWRETDETVFNTLKQAVATQSGPRFGVTHVVLCWLKRPGDEQQRKQLMETSHSFEKIPGVSLIAAGTAIPSTRPVVDSSFDVAIVMMFEDEAALRAYDAHPIHRQAVQESLRPLTQRIQIYDFRNIRP
jgi:hypothetical protein